MPCGIYHQDPGNWTPQTDTLEQRYQRLEQVARDMYSFIAINEALNGLTIRGQQKPTDKIMSLATFCEQLESLGVSLDD